MAAKYPIRSQRDSRKRLWAFSWWISVALHISALGLLVGFLLNTPVINFTSESISLEGTLGERVDEANAELRSKEDGVTDKQRWLRDIKQQIAQAEARGDQENIERLKRLTEELNRSSSTKSVEEMSEYFGGIFGKRASAPVETAKTEEFDVSTAQIHEVRRESDGGSGFAYTLVMVDAKGVTQEIDIDPENGERLYKTMKLIKSNPLLERIYRGILMGILDQVLGEPKE